VQPVLTFENRDLGNEVKINSIEEEKTIKKNSKLKKILRNLIEK
jgi:hypothetical protein